MNPLVSIIMPCYNAERYIAQSIESVLAQTYQEWELLITDGPSTDNTAEIVNDYCNKDNRIHLIIPDQHQNIAEARYTSIQHSKGKYLAFLDSDDIWVKDKLEKQVAFMIDNDYAFTYGNYQIIDPKGVSVGKTICNEGIVDYDKYLKNTLIGCGSVMIDSDKVGDIAMPLDDVNDDMGLWCSIMRNGVKAYPIDEVLYYYRVRNDGASSHRFKMMKSVWRVYRKQEQMGFWKSTACFISYAYHAVKKRLL